MRHRLKVTEHHGKETESEVVRVDIDANDGYAVVVQHLASQKSIIVEVVYMESGDEVERLRSEHIYYD